MSIGIADPMTTLAKITIAKLRFNIDTLSACMATVRALRWEKTTARTYSPLDR